MRHTLTNRQEDVLSFIISQINSRGIAPTMREIGDHFEISSTNGVNDHLKALVKKGYVKSGYYESRSAIPLRLPDGTACAVRVVEVAK